MFLDIQVDKAASIEFPGQGDIIDSFARWSEQEISIFFFAQGCNSSSVPNVCKLSVVDLALDVASSLNRTFISLKLIADQIFWRNFV